MLLPASPGTRDTSRHYFFDTGPVHYIAQLHRRVHAHDQSPKRVPRLAIDNFLRIASANPWAEHRTSCWDSTDYLDLRCVSIASSHAKRHHHRVVFTIPHARYR